MPDYQSAAIFNQATSISKGKNNKQKTNKQAKKQNKNKQTNEQNVCYAVGVAKVLEERLRRRWDEDFVNCLERKKRRSYKKSYLCLFPTLQAFQTSKKNIKTRGIGFLHWGRKSFCSSLILCHHPPADLFTSNKTGHWGRWWSRATILHNTQQKWLMYGMEGSICIAMPSTFTSDNTVTSERWQHNKVESINFGVSLILTQRKIKENSVVLLKTCSNQPFYYTPCTFHGDKWDNLISERKIHNFILCLFLYYKEYYFKSLLIAEGLLLWWAGNFRSNSEFCTSLLVLCDDFFILTFQYLILTGVQYSFWGLKFLPKVKMFPFVTWYPTETIKIRLILSSRLN